MEIETILFGKMKLPDTEEALIKELNRCRERFEVNSTRYLQCRIDYLEYALDDFRRALDESNI